MDSKEVGVNVRSWINSTQEGLQECPCKCGIGLLCSISHVLGYNVIGIVCSAPSFRNKA